MIEVEMGENRQGQHDPRIWHNGRELTDTVWSLELLPMRQARIHMYSQPYKVDKDPNHVGCVGHLRKEVIEDTYHWWAEGDD